ncbi:6-phosphogluconolactonase [Algoriphagus ornithinivorans]|uniref:6-phosphogluconolactonase n=1 Tax=Algoriphagus ornithinivorans TaxID=226506 RepID=A0A1I5GBK6_9BACT|nr:6-phosphogluconolactonase [Algoriphagus ornithinivorans]SFO33352.1 6-phosphogluconolactonase [Algoriphagus ornithinivorans]
MEIKILENKTEVAKSFSAYFAELVQSQEQLFVALSGGSTPKTVFDYLASEYRNKIDWTKVFFFWGDERCVPPTDSESNYKMTVDHLLSKLPIPEANVFRVLGENDPEEEALRYGELVEKTLPLEKGIPQFDLVILGMGDDGHTASIFPNSIYLWDSSRNCKVATHPDSGQKRVTITGRVINQAKHVVFLVTGASKKEKVREVIRREGEYNSYPASMVNPSSDSLVWYLDQEAAQEIK